MLELDWNAVNLASSQQQHQQRPGPTTIERVGASAAELPSQWSQRGSEATRCADYEADAASHELLSALCRYSIPAAACGPQQLLAKRASGSLRERQRSLQYTFSRERERECGREWERELWKLLPAFNLLCAFFSVYFCLGFLSHFLPHSAVPCSEREMCGAGGGVGRCVLCGAVSQFRQFARLQTI